MLAWFNLWLKSNLYSQINHDVWIPSWSSAVCYGFSILPAGTGKKVQPFYKSREREKTLPVHRKTSRNICHEAWTKTKRPFRPEPIRPQLSSCNASGASSSWRGFDVLISESKANSVDICIHIYNKIAQYKYKDSACWPCPGAWDSVRTGGLEVRLSFPHLLEERGVELGLQLLGAVALDDLRYFLFPPHVRGVVQVTFQALPPA